MKPWLKVLLFICCFTILLMAAGRVGYLIPGRNTGVAFGILGSLAGVFSIWLFRKVERTSWQALGFKWSVGTMPRFLLGSFIGLVGFSLLFLSILIFTPLKLEVRHSAFNAETWSALLPILPLALMEEIGFRSYPQLILNKAYGVWVSQIVMALVFAGYHVLYGWPPQVAFTGPFVWAFLFGLSALWSKGIAVPTGIHFSVNVLQAISGINGDKTPAIWKLSYPPGTSKAVMAQVNHIGLALHLCLLVLFLLLTGYLNHVLNRKASFGPDLGAV